MPEEGVEPTRFAAADFKSAVSTNSTTRAHGQYAWMTDEGQAKAHPPEVIYFCVDKLDQIRIERYPINSNVAFIENSSDGRCRKIKNTLL